MKNVITKCKNCGGALTYSPETQTLVCVYCDSCFPIEGIAVSNVLHIFDGYEPKIVKDPVNVYECNSCGSIHTSAEGDVVHRCATCGNVDLIQKTRFSLESDVFKPFSVPKKHAIGNFREWLKSRKFAPNKLKEFAREGKLTGAYVPVWHFVYDFDADYTGYIEEERAGHDGKKDTIRYIVRGSVSSSNNRKNISATSSVPEISQVGSFEEEEGIKYNPCYAYGFSMLDSNIDHNQAYKSLEYLIKSDAQSMADRKEHRAGGITIDKLRVYNVRIELCYVPVWINYYKFKDKTYRCVINGVNGQVTGKYPRSFWKILALCAAIAGGIGLVALIAFSFI